MPVLVTFTIVIFCWQGGAYVPIIGLSTQSLQYPSSPYGAPAVVGKGPDGNQFALTRPVMFDMDNVEGNVIGKLSNAACDYPNPQY